MSIDATAFTRAMSRVPGPVAVATTVDGAGRRWGFTGSSFSSLSLDPPLVLICLAKTASTHAAFAGSPHFMVNVLNGDQAEVARRFAKSGVDRFHAGDMVPCELGLPGHPDAALRLACTRYDMLDGGDHSILVGRVEALHVAAHPPLVYCDRSFTQPMPAGQLT
ncbi:flavin reductase family protein [Actinokineospora enzanensis]|uniref:flavin reductase family protein n=1 Tax=Actinokineospora enzanensis TaxID=155975 RepID=UPI00035F5B30|nr:flavin reductase family protein [Actinokineospora enzanensis]